ncbi:MAG: c-type cytochrome domain-containing protein [Bryocella sp.]
MKKSASLFLAVSAFALTAAFTITTLIHPAAVAAVAVQPDPAPNTEAYYTQKVQPILLQNCYRCHGAPKHHGGLQMNTRESLYRGGKDGAVISPGHPENSLLIKLIRHEGPVDDPMPMPPHSKLSDDDIATLTTWIKAGAVMPEGAVPAAAATPAPAAASK